MLITETLAEEAEEESRLHHLERKLARRQEKERLEELAPRADAGTHARRMEKKADVNAKMREFRDKSPDITISDNQLMGGDDVRGEILRQKRIAEERQRRREEYERGREAERVNRRRELEKREEGTMEMLKKMAAERFGSA